jgi:hypothetical protein
MRRVVVCATGIACIAISASASARPIGGAFSEGQVGHGPADGVLLGVDGAWANTFAAGGDPSHDGWGFGVRAGYAFGSGLELHLRYDDLGVEPGGRSPLQLATAGLRYSVPFLFPMPFAEVDAGPAFVLGDVDFGAGGALGLAFPIVNHVLVDVAAHDWFVPIGGTIRQTLTVGLGLAVTFGGPR